MLVIKLNDETIIAPIVIDGYGKQNGIVIDSNAMTSTYGRKNAVTKLLKDAIADEQNGKFGIFYINKKEAATLLPEAGPAIARNRDT